jgi:hypothetical protein
MFEKWRIKQHMEITDAAGQHIGTVDEVADGQIKLTRTDSADGKHHYLSLDDVDKIEDNRVYLKAGTPLATGGSATGATARTTTAAGAGGAVAAGYGGEESSGSVPGDPPLFGTSGHGTGMGGSGPT